MTPVKAMQACEESERHISVSGSDPVKIRCSHSADNKLTQHRALSVKLTNNRYFEASKTIFVIH